MENKSTRWGCVLFISNIQLWILKTGKSTRLGTDSSFQEHRCSLGTETVLRLRGPCRQCLFTLGVRAIREQRRVRERRLGGRRDGYLFQRVVNLVVILKLWPPLPRRAVSRLLFNFLLQIGDKHPVDGRAAGSGKSGKYVKSRRPACFLKQETNTHGVKLFELPINDVIISKAEETKYTAFLKSVYTKTIKPKIFLVTFTL